MAEENKVTVHTNSLARGSKIKGKGASKKVELTFEKDSEEHKITVDKILVTVGRSPTQKVGD